MKHVLNDGEAYVAGRSPEKARELLALAAEKDLVGSVRTTSSGYIIPTELGYEGAVESDDDNLVEVGNNLPEEGYTTAIDDAEVAASVASDLLADVQPVADAGAVEGGILNQSEPTNASTEGTAEGNGSSVVGDSAVPVQGAEGEKQFDPSEHTVEQVEAYLETADDAERERVLAAEKEGKARKSLHVETEEESK